MVAFRYGWVPQEPDPRDFQMTVSPRITANLPTSYSLAPNMPGQLNQQAVGSCGAHAAAENIMFDQHVEGIDVSTPSRLFIYWITRNLMGTLGSDSGVDNRSMSKALAQYGFCDESLWPYDGSPVNQDGTWPAGHRGAMTPTPDCFAAALPNRISNYVAVPQQIDQMKGCIVSGHPFVLGFVVYPQLESDQCAQDGLVMLPNRLQTPIGGHDILAYKFDDTKVIGNQVGAIGCRNHWVRGDGSPYGDHGDLWLPYSYVTNPRLASNYWAYNAIPGGIPKPPKPSPDPAPPAPPSPPASGSITVRTGKGDLIVLTGSGLTVVS